MIPVCIVAPSCHSRVCEPLIAPAKPSSRRLTSRSAHGELFPQQRIYLSRIHALHERQSQQRLFINQENLSLIFGPSFRVFKLFSKFLMPAWMLCESINKKIRQTLMGRSAVSNIVLMSINIITQRHALSSILDYLTLFTSLFITHRVQGI